LQPPLDKQLGVSAALLNPKSQTPNFKVSGVRCQK